MLTCKDVAERATEYMERSLTPRMRMAVRFHLAFCRMCRAYLRQMRATVSFLRRLGQEESSVPEPTRARILATFAAWSPPSHDRSRVPASYAARMLSAFDLLLGGWRGVVGSFVLVLGSLALLLAVRPTEGAPIPAAAGLMCLGMELAAGVLPLAAVVLLTRQTGRRVSPGVYAVAAGAGALVGQTSIHFTCPRDGMHLHLLAFHVGGVLIALLAGVAASALQRPLVRP